MTEATSIRWRSPEELVEIGFSRSRVVMMNEAHNDWLRCVRTRKIGTRVLPLAHDAGVRYLAMEALFAPDLVEAVNDSRDLPEVRGPSYLAQSDMRISSRPRSISGGRCWAEADMRLAPDGWDPMGEAFTNWREEQQARNLLKAIDGLGSEARVLVWCGNGHLYKDRSPKGDRAWVPMGSWLRELSGIEQFAIDQTQTVEFGHRIPSRQVSFMKRRAPELRSLGGTAGFLADEAPDSWTMCGVDALLLSVENHME